MGTHTSIHFGRKSEKADFFLTTADEKIINVGMQRVLRCESWKVIVKVLHYGRGTTNNQQSK